MLADSTFGRGRCNFAGMGLTDEMLRRVPRCDPRDRQAHFGAIQGWHQRLKQFALIGVLALASCNNNPNRDGHETLDAITGMRLNRIEERLIDVESQTSQLSGEGRAFLTPSGKGYSFIKSDIGMLTFELTGVKPYADGSRITLKIGNPTSAKITSLEMNLRWGPVNEKGLMIYDPPPREMKHVVADPIAPSSWNIVTVDLGGIPPSKFGQLIVENVSATGMTLTK